MVRIPLDLYDELVKLSKAQERTVSQTIRFLLREALAK